MELSPSQNEIYEYLKTKNAVDIPKMAKDLNRSKSALHHSLKRLLELNIIKKEIVSKRLQLYYIKE